MTIVLDGKKTARKLREKNKERLKQLKEKQVTPKLVIVRIGSDSSSVSYEKAAVREMKRVGIASSLVTLPEETTDETAIETLMDLNNDQTVHGILVMQPLPKQLTTHKITETIAPEKDIDGMSVFNLGNMLQPGENYFIPSTPQAVMRLLKEYDIPLKGKEVVVVGSSAVVGKPLSLLLLNEGATVTVCHIHTEDLLKHTAQAEIIISATGALGLITKDHVKKGAVVVDVGYGYDRKGNICGDVRYEEVFEKAAYITPVPGGVGAMTSSILAEHVLVSAEKHAHTLLKEG